MSAEKEPIKVSLHSWSLSCSSCSLPFRNTCIYIYMFTWLGSQYFYQRKWWKEKVMSFTVHLGAFHSFLHPQRHCRKWILFFLRENSWYMLLKVRLVAIYCLVPQIFTSAAYLLLQPVADTKRRAFQHNTPSCNSYRGLLSNKVLICPAGFDKARKRLPKVVDVPL